MGRRARRVVGVAAMIAAPFAAPAIAGKLGVSSLIGKSLIGAGVGAAGSRMAGGRLSQGAIGGFLTTGISQGIQGWQAARAAEAANTANMGLNTAGVPNSLAAPAALGEQAANMGLNASGVPNALAATPASGSAFVPSYVGGSAGSTLGTAATNTGGFMNALRSIGGGIFSNVQDPAAAAQLVTQLGGALIGGKDPGDQLSRDQMAALQQLREQDERSYNELMAAAQNLMSQANNIDPESEGRMQAGLTQQRTARSALESGRSAALNPNNAAVDYSVRARQNEVLGHQAAESAYQGGFMNAKNRRAGLYAQGARLIPQGAKLGAFNAGTSMLPSMQGDDRWDALGQTINTAGNAFGWWNRTPDEDKEGGRP